MIDIAIDATLKATPLTLGCLSAAVKVTDHDVQLWKEIEFRMETLTHSLCLEHIPSLGPIRAQRDAYRVLGKSPSRYRGSAEALLRRILQGKGLTSVNTLVDINNLLSLETYHPVGSYDCRRLRPPLTFRVGIPGEVYSGLGKGEINLEKLPVFADTLGPFGSPTSDSNRAGITTESQEILIIIIAFAASEEMVPVFHRAADLLKRYAAARYIETAVVV